MKDVVVSKRYAKALFQLAHEQKKVSEIENELYEIKKYITQDTDFEKFLNHPNIQASAKTQVINQTFAGKISGILLSAIEILVENRRINILSELLNDYTKLANEEMGQAQAIIYTSHALKENELNQIVQKFSQVTGKKIRAEVQVDSSLLGGIQIKIGDRLYDGSLAGKLKQMSKNLEQSQVM